MSLIIREAADSYQPSAISIQLSVFGQSQATTGGRKATLITKC